MKVPFNKLTTTSQIEAISEVLELILATPGMNIIESFDLEEMLCTENFTTISMMILLDDFEDDSYSIKINEIWDIIRAVDREHGFKENGEIIGLQVTL